MRPRPLPHLPSRVHRPGRGRARATIPFIDLGFVDQAAEALLGAGNGDVIDAIPHLVATLTTDGRVRSINRAGREMVGPIAGEGIADRVPEPWRSRLVREGLPTAMRCGAWQGELSILGVDGAEIPVSQTIVAHRDVRGAPDYLVTFMRDVSERRRFEAQLVYFVDHDRVTGLFNRSRFEEEVERALEAAGRTGAPGSLVVLDIDSFGSINRRAGMRAADELLVGVARELRALEPPAIAARLAGDSFAVLLPGIEASGAARIADGLRRAVAAAAEPASCPATASLGVAGWSARDDDPGELIVRAERALALARERGGDAVAIAGPESRAR